MVGKWPIMFVTALVVLLCMQSSALAQNMEEKVARLENLVHQQEQALAQTKLRLEELEQANGEEWMTARKQEQIKELISEVLADADTRSQLAGSGLTAGYKEGFFIRTEDNSFKLKIGTRLQFRYTGKNVDGAWAGDDNDVSAFEIERAKIAFKGHLWNKNLKYKIQLDADGDGDGVVGLEDWYIDYQFDKALVLRLGQFKVAQGQQELTSSGKQQLVDRSMANEAFNLDRAVGIMAHGKLLQDIRKDFIKYMVGIYNGFDTDNQEPDNLDSNMAFSARLEFILLGGDKAAKALKGESDLKQVKDPTLRFGMYYGFEDFNKPEKRLRNLGISDHNRGEGDPGVARLNTLGTELHQWGYDVRFKYRGLSVNAEHYIRAVDDDGGHSFGTDNYSDLTHTHDTKHYQGGYVQVGYFLGEEFPLEPVFRLGGIWDNDNDNVWEVAGGVNYYIHGHNLKISADVTRIAENAARSSASGFDIGEDMWMFRAQLQVAF